MFTFLSMNILVFAQNYLLSTAANNTTISTCGGNFYDSGGATGQYTNNQNRTITFCPSTPGAMIRLNFTAFALENSYDFLYIYNGTSTAAPLLGTYTGTNNPGVVTANNPSGCITIRFTSDYSVLANGWAAAISCIAQGTCTDGIQNQGEVGIDCGGPCAACPPIPCNVNLTYTSVPANLTCAGGTVSLTAVGIGAYNQAMNNSFNGGSLGPGWIATGGQSVGTLCGPSLDGTPYYWASTAGSSVPQLTTAVLNVSCGGIISFDMDYATQGGNTPCEGPDLPNEGVTFQYSTNGGATWTVIQYWNPLGGYNAGLTNWNTYSFPIPPGAIGPNTQFQWIQLSSSGSLYDNWGIDNVQISSVINCNAYWYNYSFLPPLSDNPVQTTNITSTTTFNVTYTNGIDACNTSLTVVVPPGTTANAGPDKVRCSGGAGVVIGANPVSPDNGATYSWSAGAGSGTIDLIPAGGTTTGQVTVSPLVTTTYTLSVTFNGCTVTDQVTVVVDNPPTASNPAPITLACASAIPAPDITVVTTEADDITILPIVTWISDVSNGGTCPNIVTRTYRVTDGCGNFVNVTQTITVSDNILPTGTAPANVTVQCIANVPAQNVLLITDEADNCSAPTVTFVSDVSAGTCPIIITRTYRITDACNNFINVTQTITVQDTQVPVFTAPPAAVSVQCAANVPAMTNLGWTDNCTGAGSVVGTDGALVGGTCGGTITRTWTYTDLCGNNATVTQTITINDTQVPVFAAPPAAVSVQCATDVPAMTNLGWTDNCTGAGSVTGTDGALVGTTCGGTITRTWTYTDACGNNATVTQTITINDTQVPVFAAPPAAISVQCATDVPAMTNLGWTDNCTGTGSVAGTDGALVGTTCGGTITRTWTYTDLCGNNATVSQTITINDTQVPVFDAPPAAVSVQCATDVPAMTNLSWTDNCTGAGSVAGTDGALVGGACGGTITRTWTYSDLCGNNATVTQIITINDTQVPVFSAPSPAVTVDCLGAVPAMTNLSWTDNCTGAGSVTGTDGALVGGECGGTITRTWTYTDLCGNVATATQIITVDDNTLPTASNPVTTTVPGGPAPAVDILVVIDEGDNCSVPVVAFVSESTDGASCPETITRIYSVTDACGNTINVTHLILITDPINPTASNPGALNVQCIGDVPLPNILVVTDEADNQGVPTVAFVSDVSNGLTCPEVITRTYSVTDICNNAITVTQTITVLDTQVPVFAAPPAAVSVQCATDVPAMTNLGWTDNCTGAGTVTGTDGVLVGGTCGGTITRTWTYTDAVWKQCKCYSNYYY